MSAGFRGLWFSTGAANLGDGIALFLLPLLAIAVAASDAEVALVTTAATLAWPLFGLHGGWIVDRVNRSVLLLVVNGTRGAMFAVVAFLQIRGELTVPLILAAAVIYGICEVLADTTLTSLVPALVDIRQRDGANARIEATINFSNQLLGPPLAGLIAGISLGLASTSSAALYLLALAGLPFVASALRKRPRPPRGSVDRRLRTGLVYLWRHPLLRPITIFTGLMNLVWSAWGAVFVLYALGDNYLGLDAAGYGLILAGMAVGGLAASVLVPALARRFRMPPLLFLDTITTILLVAPAALGANVWVTAAGVVLAGAGSSIWRILVATIRQSHTPEPLLGRVYSASRVVSWGALPVGAALASVVVGLWGLTAVFAAASVVAVIVAIWFAFVVWRLDFEPTTLAQK